MWISLDEDDTKWYNNIKLNSYNNIEGNQLTAEDTGSLMFFIANHYD